MTVSPGNVIILVSNTSFVGDTPGTKTRRNTEQRRLTVWEDQREQNKSIFEIIDEVGYSEDKTFREVLKKLPATHLWIIEQSTIRKPFFYIPDFALTYVYIFQACSKASFLL